MSQIHQDDYFANHSLEATLEQVLESQTLYDQESSSSTTTKASYENTVKSWLRLSNNEVGGDTSLN